MQSAPSIDDVAAAMTPHLPQPVDHILVQADLTAVAPGPLDAEGMHVPVRVCTYPPDSHGYRTEPT